MNPVRNDAIQPLERVGLSLGVFIVKQETAIKSRKCSSCRSNPAGSQEANEWNIGTNDPSIID